MVNNNKNIMNADNKNVSISNLLNIENENILNSENEMNVENVLKNLNKYNRGLNKRNIN